MANVQKVSFCGLAQSVPRRVINCAADAIEQWAVLKHPKYTEIYQEAEKATPELYALNKQIRESNFSFLDELKNDVEKAKFIKYFKDFTGFPSFEKVTKKIEEEFVRVLKFANKKIVGLADNTIAWGYDKFCSVGLKSAFPGSDLDKGFAIVDDFTDPKLIADEIKNKIWHNIDSRIMSVNHCASFPNVMTKVGFLRTLRRFDEYACKLFFPHALGDERIINHYHWRRNNAEDAIFGAKFNIDVANQIRNVELKTEAKNFAYLLESFRDGKKYVELPKLNKVIMNFVSASPFYHLSNIAQLNSLEKSYLKGRPMKEKLLARHKVAEEFDNWSIAQQYELVKDIIRSMSGDSRNPDFKHLFVGHGDARRKTLHEILVGKVKCDFSQKLGEPETVNLSIPGTNKRVQLSSEDEKFGGIRLI